MAIVQARVVPRKCGEPIGWFNRPSIEYTGRGNTLFCLAWNGRYFRSSEADVRRGCAEITKRCNGTEEEDGEPVSIADLENELGIRPDDAGYRTGWPSNENYSYPCFTFEWCGEGTYLYDVFGENVLMIVIPELATPIDCYMEVS